MRGGREPRFCRGGRSPTSGRHLVERAGPGELRRQGVTEPAFRDHDVRSDDQLLSRPAGVAGGEETAMTTTETANSVETSGRWAFLTDGPPIRKPVFYSAVIGVLVMATWAIFAPDQAESVIGDAVAKVVDWFGWFYVLLTTVVLVFVVYLAISRYGSIKLGPDHSKPQFSTFAWASMLFAAGIGTDVMFYAVAEPVSQYMTPPTGDPETVAAAREATVWTLFHYGISGWGLYALMGMALGYFTYRMNLPLAVRSALYPIFGRRVDGGLGHVVDTAAVLGTIFGVATSLGIGVVFLNQGLNILFDVPIGIGAQIGLVVVAVAMAAVSATTGVDRGIRFLSQLNVILALGLAAYVLLTGRTSFILNAVVMNVGDYARPSPARRWRPSRSTARLSGCRCGRCSSGPGGSLGRPSWDCSWPGSLAVGRSGSSSPER